MQDEIAITLALDCIFTEAMAAGTIDPLTGVFSATGSCIVGPEFGTFQIDGVATSDSATFAGSFTCPPDAIPGTVDYTATRTCPDGTLDPGEDCDDGNLENEDACSNLCTINATPCDDGDPCTRGVVDLLLGCTHVEAPALGCRTAGKALLLLKDNANDPQDKLVWKWLKGAETSQQQFGMPTGTTAFTLCIYAGSAVALVARAEVPPDPVKWRPISDKGWKYKDQSGAADGVQKMLLKGGAVGKSKVLVKGKGAQLPDLPSETLPVAADGFPVTVQLFNNATSPCWASAFAAGDVKKNTAEQFKAKSEAP
jgi:cysteine-rich repeat protein